MTSVLNRRERRAELVDRHNARLRAADPERHLPVTLDEWHAEWDAELAKAVRRQPVEPRLRCAWPSLELFEEWALSRGWYRVGMGPHAGINGNNVYLNRLPASPDAMRHPDDDTEEAGDG